MDNNIILPPKVLVSIVIPCYNSGAFLPEALASVLNFPALNTCEVIVVNDGSTDALTLEVLEQAEVQGCRVFHQVNKGPAAARNTGITYAQGKYIVFLDSDNKIRHDYITDGIAVLDKHPEVGVVYGRAAFFGNATAARFTGEAFDPYKLLLHNTIDMCTVIRKRMWADLGGLDEERLLIGHEDWEFWIRANGAGWKFHFVDKILFDYRIRGDSLVTEAIKPLVYDEMVQYVQQKNWKQYMEGYKALYGQYRAYQYDKNRPVRSFFKYTYKTYLSK
jgi:glycosyltransferase involved in cell wall biosynthesis